MQWILDDNARQMPAPYTEAAPGSAPSGGQMADGESGGRPVDGRNCLEYPSLLG